MMGGKAFENFVSKIKKTIEEAAKINGVEALSEKLVQAVSKFEKLVNEIKERSKAGNVLNTFSFAHPFLEITGDLTVAWMLLWRASVAAPILLKKVGSFDNREIAKKASNNKDAAFYAGQLNTAKFFINKLLPATMGKMDAVFEGDTSVEDMPEASFGSK